MLFDDLLIQHLGQFGRYQKWLCFLLSLIGIPVAFNNMEIVFLAAVPDFWCQPADVPVLKDLPQDIVYNVTMPWMYKDENIVRDNCHR